MFFLIVRFIILLSQGSI